MTTIEVLTCATPAGRIIVAVRDGAVCALSFSTRKAQLRQRLERRFGAVKFVARRESGNLLAQLRRWFAGDTTALKELPVDVAGTPFQAAVWKALRRIPAGTTITYRELAQRVGRPTAVRAVASANAQNPVSLLIPCHRVIGSDGRLHGYAGGLDRKAWLLSFEAQQNSRPR